MASKGPITVEADLREMMDDLMMPTLLKALGDTIGPVVHVKKGSAGGRDYNAFVEDDADNVRMTVLETLENRRKAYAEYSTAKINNPSTVRSFDTLLRFPGENTVVPIDAAVRGALSAISMSGHYRPRSMLCFGTGDAAHDILPALSRLGYSVTNPTLLLHDPDTAALSALDDKLADETRFLDHEAMGEALTYADVVADLGTADGSGRSAPVMTEAQMKANTQLKVVIDTSIDPVETDLVKAARAAGKFVVTGSDLLLYRIITIFAAITKKSVDLPSAFEVIKHRGLR